MEKDVNNIPGKPALYRRRYIPDEKVYLKDDIILHHDKEVLITRWKTLRPKTQFDSGVSCYFLEKGIKISKFFLGEALVCYYIDIIETHQGYEEIVFNDLLIDIVVENTGMIKVMDLGQIPQALEEGLITSDQAMSALRVSAWLLDIIYEGQLGKLLEYFGAHHNE